MILSTTPTIEGHPIREYRGVVTGETIIGTNFVKDFFASVRDVIGGRSGSYESTLRQAKDTALREMADRAASLGCNAIVGIDLDYETVGNSGSMLMVTCSGTAVIISDIQRGDLHRMKVTTLSSISFILSPNPLYFAGFQRS